MIKQSTPTKDVLELTHPCSCRACQNGCMFGSGVFLDSQLKTVAEKLKITEDELKQKHLETVTKFGTTKYRPKLIRKDGKPYGQCTFFHKKTGCTIHDVKPFECTVAMPCKEYGEQLILWFTLNTFLDKEDEDSMREYKAYLKAGGKTLPE